MNIRNSVYEPDKQITMPMVQPPKKDYIVVDTDLGSTVITTQNIVIIFEVSGELRIELVNGRVLTVSDPKAIEKIDSIYLH